MDPRNPYLPPAADPRPSGGDPAAFAELVRGWEKLRLLFNAILLLPGIAVLAMWVKFAAMPVVVAGVLAAAVAVAANVAFLLGPVVELYLRAMFRSGASIGRGRWLIFGAGLVVSAGVFVVAGLLATLAP